MEKNTENNMGIFELFILNKIHNIPIIISINGVEKYFINNNIINIKSDYVNKNNQYIYIDFDIANNNQYPNIEVLYYK